MLFICNNQFIQRDLLPYPSPLLGTDKPDKKLTIFMKLAPFCLGKKEVHIKICNEYVLTYLEMESQNVEARSHLKKPRAERPAEGPLGSH